MANFLRSTLDAVQAMFPGKTVSQSYLRLERTLQGLTDNNIQFPVLQTDQVAGQTSSAVERRLPVNDVFVCTAVTLSVYKAGTTTSATDTDRSKARLLYSLNPLVFNGAGEADNLMTIYNGYLQFMVNQIVTHESLDTVRFYRAGLAQKGVGSSATDNQPVQLDEYPEQNYPFAQLIPNLILGGQSKNQLSLFVPVVNSYNGTSSTNFISLIFRGYQVQGAGGDFERNFQSFIGRI